MLTKQIEVRFADSGNTNASTSLEEVVKLTKDEMLSNDQADFIVRETFVDRPGRMGPEWLPVLTAILSAPAVLLAIEEMFKIIKARLADSPSLIVTLANGPTTVTITSYSADRMSASEIAQALNLG